MSREGVSVRDQPNKETARRPSHQARPQSVKQMSIHTVPPDPEKSTAKANESTRPDRPGPRPVNPSEYPPEPAWVAHLQYGNHGQPLNCLANVISVFRESDDWKDVLAFNEFALKHTVRRRPPWPSTIETPNLPYAWSDSDTVRACEWLQVWSPRRIEVGKELVNDAVDVVAREHAYHPLEDYFTDLKWDGEERIEYWLGTYLGADPTPILHAFGPRLLIAAVARIFEPGCQVDTILVLEGPQGKYKSTALSVLAGQEYFSDQLPDIRSKDAAIQLLGKLMIEVAEMDAFKGMQSSTIKAFLSRRTDRFRPPYGKRAVDVPRSCLFVTENLPSYLHDETGGRRYWPVRVGDIDIAKLRRDRDQLWAEAVYRYQRGDVWYLDTAELEAAAKEEQDARYEHDPWDERIKLFLASRQNTSISEILEVVVKKPRAEWTQSDHNRVARTLQYLNWEKYRPTNQDGGRPYRYRPKFGAGLI